MKPPRRILTIFWLGKTRGVFVREFVIFCRFVFLPFNKNRNFAKFGCARGAGSLTPSVTPCQPPAAPKFWVILAIN